MLTSQPHFSGFYAIDALEKRLDQLPIGSKHGLPYQYGSFGPTSFAYTLPQNDDDFRRALDAGGVEYHYAEDDAVIQQIVPQEHRHRFTDPSGRTLESMNVVFRNWTNRICARLGAAALADIFGSQNPLE